MNVALAEKLEAEGIPFQRRLDLPGTHTGEYWVREMHRVWPDLIRTLESST